MANTLYYVHDPMCSWCWAFNPTWQRIKAGLAGDTVTRIVLGGLAPDSSDPMPAEMQSMLQATWKRIELVVPGTKFNFAFWEKCQPRRSTYPACRAVLAARALSPEYEEAMIHAIQAAYYLNARNPSDDSVLIELSEEIGCDRSAFAARLNSEEIEESLSANLQFAGQIGATGFPSLILQSENNELHRIQVDYTSAINILDQIAAATIRKTV